MSFEQMKREARKLPLADLKRHASVSLDNKHQCKSCFTCACVEVSQDYFARVQWAEYPQNESRDYYQEALAILNGSSMMQPEREHLRALRDKHLEDLQKWQDEIIESRGF